MDVSIIIVSWNVKDLLRRCLASVIAQTKGVRFEVFVVDNASSDGSAAMVAAEFPGVTLIVNTRNTGFAAACNEGIRRAKGEFVLLLNPDAELREDAISTLVAAMRARPEVGIAGPKLANPDGSLQPSVRRFPTPLSQLLILLKLHRIPSVRKAASLRRYFADDMDYGAAQRVDQVMGAAFLIRGSVLRDIGLLDERFFIWFEEVDFCKRAADRGIQTWYLPETTIVHHGGASFAKEFGVVKQRYFNASMRTYMRLHHGVLAAAVVTLLHPISMALAWLFQQLGMRKHLRQQERDASSFGSITRRAVLYFLLFELISLYGFLIPAVSTAAFFAIVLSVAVLAWRRFDLALLALLAELFVGSQGGYMVAYAGDGLFVSLRLGLFLAVFSVWLARSVIGIARQGLKSPELAWFTALRERRLLMPYVALLAAIAYGVLRGIALGNDRGEIFFDANGYFFLALLPAFLAGFAASKALPRLVLATLCAAVTVSVTKALVVLFFFSHRQFLVAWNLYVWVRDTRVGEITIMVADFYRIFFQSQIWALGLIVAGVVFAAYLPSWRDKRARAAAAIVAWAMVAMVLSLSRSFWFGGAVAGLACVGLLVYAKAEAKIWRRAIALVMGSVICASLVIASLYAFPYPSKTGEFSLAGLLGSRAMSLGDAAASSRWALLPKLMEAGSAHPVLGNGLGKTVIYTTSDPRLLAENPTGEYTTAAFEWGYHDLWVKFGLFGIAAYGWFIWRVLSPFITRIRKGRAALSTIGIETTDKEQTVIAGGLVLAVIALLATNIFSPYLNHPLGIGLLMLIAAYGVAENMRRESIDRNAAK